MLHARETVHVTGKIIRINSPHFKITNKNLQPRKPGLNLTISFLSEIEMRLNLKISFLSEIEKSMSKFLLVKRNPFSIINNYGNIRITAV